MKKLLMGAACAMALATAGCAQVDAFETWVTSPKTAATLKALSQAATVFICDVSAVSDLASKIETAVGADKSTLGTTGKIYTGSSTICTGLGGTVTGSTAAPAGTNVVE